MFNCEKCGRTTKAGEKMAKQCLKKRPRKYPNGSEGWEIAKEISVCEWCKDK